MELENENGDIMHLADDLTLKELVDMGISIVVSEDATGNMEHWIPVDNDE